VTLTWQDPNNNPGEVGGYNLYYWQTRWNAPASVNVGNQTTYTLTGLEAGQTYHFAITAHDGTGGRESVYSNTVTKTFPTSAPTASFTVNPTSGSIPLQVAYTDTSTGSITSWAWSFGDGAVSNQQNPNHTYIASGNYMVRLTVTGSGGSDTITKSLTVSMPGNNLVAAFSFDEGDGTTVADVSGNTNNGTISGATWTSQGKYGKTLSFDGVNDWVTVADTPALDLTTGMTFEAWIYPTTTTGVRDILIKAGANVDIYNLYARNWLGLPEANVLWPAHTMAPRCACSSMGCRRLVRPSAVRLLSPRIHCAWAATASGGSIYKDKLMKSESTTVP
jgi:PKD repeat protein